MLDLRPVGYVVGLMVMGLGLAMVLPMLVDIAEGSGHWTVFAECAILTVLIGGLVALASRNGVREGLTLQQTFFADHRRLGDSALLWRIALYPGGYRGAGRDAIFEAMSGLTTLGQQCFRAWARCPKACCCGAG